MIKLTWGDVRSRMRDIPDGKLYGVPRGGAIVAGLIGREVDDPADADVIVDDIVDSGRTRERYLTEYPGKPFWSLIDKQKEGIDRWVLFPWEKRDGGDLEDTVVRQLEFIGENPNRNGLKDTPKRVIKALREMTCGYGQNPKEILGRVFEERFDEMIMCKDIEFYSLCEHHMLPFYGTATIGYVSKTGNVVGLSKLTRLVYCFSRRLQIQERLTTQIAEALQEHLDTTGVGVVVKARHMCMQVRGVRNSSWMITNVLLGAMRDDAKMRTEFLDMARK